MVVGQVEIEFQRSSHDLDLIPFVSLPSIFRPCPPPFPDLEHRIAIDLLLVRLRMRSHEVDVFPPLEPRRLDLC